MAQCLHMGYDLEQLSLRINERYKNNVAQYTQAAQQRSDIDKDARRTRRIIHSSAMVGGDVHMQPPPGECVVVPSDSEIRTRTTTNDRHSVSNRMKEVKTWMFNGMMCRPCRLCTSGPGGPGGPDASLLRECNFLIRKRQPRTATRRSRTDTQTRHIAGARRPFVGGRCIRGR